MKRILGVVSLVIFFVLQFVFYDKYGFGDWRNLTIQLLAMVFAAIGATLIIPKKIGNLKVISVKKQESGALKKRTIFSAFVTLIAIPITICVGMKLFGDKRYYLISLLIIFEIMIPFFVSFEKRRTDAKELVLISLVCAIAVAGRAVFFALPQFKPIIAIVVIVGICFGGDIGFLVGAICAFVSNFYFGQGIWTPWQMIGFGIVGFLSGIIFQNNIIRITRINICIFGGLATVLIYGGIVNPASLMIMGETITKDSLMAIYISGLPFDLMHAAASVLFLWVLAEPIIEKLERLKSKYGLYAD